MSSGLTSWVPAPSRLPLGNCLRAESFAVVPDRRTHPSPIVTSPASLLAVLLVASTDIAPAIATALASVSTARHLSFLGFDYGVKRVGVATGNSLTSTASALVTLSSIGDARFAAIARLIAEWKPDALVVGVPYHPDGQAHENTHKAKRFANQLHGRFNLPVHQVDERYSTTEAESLGARDLDSASAALILEQYLRQLAAQAPAAS
ncbi:hypothetical protein BH09PSE5_BH09PSE5_14350 [soil metagenome]